MAVALPSKHPSYSTDQLERYYDCISLPSKYRKLLSNPSSSSSIGNCPDALQFLSALLKYHITNVPFENLDLHYSFHHRSPVTPEDVFEKIVDRGAGRGGWCLQMNCLFGTVLRSLGYEMFTTAGRVHSAVNTMGGPVKDRGYYPLNHMVNIVTINSQRYLVDVGFGSGGPTTPIPLVPDYSAVGVAPRTIRLLHAPIPEFADQSILMWCYQYCNAPDAANPQWTPVYCFSETEFLPSDFAVINHYITTHPSSFWLRCVVAIKMIMNDEEEIIGEVKLIGKSVTRTIGGRVEKVTPLRNEKERIQRLDELLGIILTTAEQSGITELQTALW